MRQLIPLLALVVAACGSTPAPTTTTAPSATTGTTATSIAAATTTTAPVVPGTSSVEYTVTDCGTPPVTFALLCDVYELIEDHHVDAPLDPAALAAGAALGVEGFGADDAGDRPESFTCAIPDPAFETTCSILAERLRAVPLDMEEAIEAGVSSMIDLSLDPFTYYLPPELSGALSEDGIVTAVGLLLRITDPVGSVCTAIQGECRLEVVLSILDGPGYEAGLRAGDVITSVDGEDVAGATLVDVAALLDGDAGTTVSVDVVGADGQAGTVTIERSAPPSVSLEMEQPVPGVAYIRLPDFEADIPVFLHTVLESLAASDVDRLVLDLRDNPGGYVDVATLVASEFLSDGLVLRSLGPDGDLNYPVQEGGLATSGLDLSVVVNSGSASAAEILAGVLQERGRATVVGEPTFGKNTVQIAFPLRNDGQLRVTIAEWVTPDGNSVAGSGVTPDVLIDIPVDATPEEVVNLVLG